MNQRGENVKIGSSPGRRRGRIRILATGIIGALALGLLALTIVQLRRSRSTDQPDDGTAAYHRGDYRAASRLARARLQIRSNDADALRLLARASLRLGDEGKAQSIYKSLGDEGLRGEDYYLLGLQQHRRGDLVGSASTWQLGVTKDASHVAMLRILATTLGQLDRFIPAVVVVKQLMNQPGERPRANLVLGDLYTMMNAPEQAAIAIKRGLDEVGTTIDPAELGEKRRLLARCLLRTGQPEKAREALRLIGGQEQSQPETIWLHARCDLQERKALSAAVKSVAEDYRNTFPLTPEPAPYVGAAKCGKCHMEIFERQQHSRHSRTFLWARQVASLPYLPVKSVPDPADPRVVHTYHKAGDHIEVETRTADKVVQSIVDYAFGSGDRARTLVGHNEKNHYFEIRLSYYSKPDLWDLTSGQSAHPDDAVSYQGSLLNLDSVRRCILCHQTNPMAILTKSGPEAADPAIGCEKCHGPGGNHVRVIESSALPLPKDLAIARPSQARGEPVIQLCGQCHDPRNLESPITPLSEAAIRFQASSIRWSRCYLESDQKLDCVTCHNPHHDADTRPETYERQCLECHSGEVPASDRSDPADHLSHAAAGAGTICPVQPTSGCISCHMPKEQTAFPHSRFTDHHIRVRRDLPSEAKPKSKSSS